VGITDDQLDATQATLDKTAKKRRPKRSVFAQTYVKAQNLTFSVFVHTHGYDKRLV
jgi:hypothetical protein